MLQLILGVFLPQQTFFQEAPKNQQSRPTLCFTDLLPTVLIPYPESNHGISLIRSSNLDIVKVFQDG